MHSQGEQLVLNCQSDGGPQLEYAWVYEGNEVTNIPTLTIDNVTASNGGNYTCNVTNDAGYDNNTISVYSKLVLSGLEETIWHWSGKKFSPALSSYIARGYCINYMDWTISTYYF